MAALDRNVKFTCGNCGTSVTKLNLSRHKLRCSGGILYWPDFPNIFTKSKDDLIYHFAKKHSAAAPKNNHTCKECSIEFPCFYSPRQHKQRYYTAETNSRGDKVDLQSVVDAGDNKSFEEDLQSYRHFLVDSEIQKRRHCVFNFVVDNLTAQVIEENWIMLWIN